MVILCTPALLILRFVRELYPDHSGIYEAISNQMLPNLELYFTMQVIVGRAHFLGALPLVSKSEVSRAAYKSTLKAR